MRLIAWGLLFCFALTGCQSQQDVDRGELDATAAGARVDQDERVLPANRPVDATEPNIDLR